MSGNNKKLNILLLLSLVVAAKLTGQSVEIWEIQGTSSVSPFLNSIVTTENNVITAIGDNLFYIQTPSERSDDDPLSSDGILVDVGFDLNIQVGDVVSVTGRIQEEDGMTRFGSVNLEIVIENGSLPLPEAVPLTTDFPSGEIQTIPDLERVEGMLVSFTAKVGAPSNGINIAGLYTTEDRPFREPGIKYPGLNNLPVWDGNPEVFWFDPDGLGAPNNRFLSFGMEVTADAVMTEDEGTYIATPTSYSTNGSPMVESVRDKEFNEITIGSINALRLFSDNDNYTDRLRKLALYIVQSLKNPDILAFQEVGSLSVLQDLIFYIDQLSGETGYSAYLQQGFDDINTGFLIAPLIDNISVTQLGNDEFFSGGGMLHDRPPLLLEGMIQTSPPTPINVLNLHMRSLIGIEGPNASFVRTKRYEQSQSVAEMVQAFQGENLVIVGDFNAYEFTDGYVDVVNQITGQESLGALFQPVGIVSPAITNHVFSLPPTERYSYVFQGNAQLLDQCLSTELDGLSVSELQFARGNADAADAYEDNEQLVQSTSDHDGFVLFIETTNPLVSREDIPSEICDLSIINPASLKDPFRLPFCEEESFTYRLIDLHGKVWLQGEINNANQTTSFPASMTTGIYFLQVQSDRFQKSIKLILTD